MRETRILEKPLGGPLKDSVGRAWLILADDLTGAADCAAAFAKRGASAIVAWGDGAHEAFGDISVLSYDVRSRGLPAHECAVRLRAATDRFLGGGGTLFKKIDSTLRGRPATEIATVLAALANSGNAPFCVMTPAYPAMGRAVIDGRVFVHGEPLETTEIWRRDRSYSTSDLVVVLASAGVLARKIPLDLIRGDKASLRAALLNFAATGARASVCDAVHEDDLARLVAALSPAPTNFFFAGSAGLAHALAAASIAGRADATTFEHTRRGTLIVVGSSAERSRAAARRLAAEPTTRHCPASPVTLLGDGDDKLGLLRETIAGLEAGADVLVDIRSDAQLEAPLDARLSGALAELLAPAAAHVGAVAATGGETAAALLDRFGVSGLRLIDEIEPGVCLGKTCGTLTFPVVTKAGDFGGEETLVRSAARLRSIKLEGTSA